MMEWEYKTIRMEAKGFWGGRIDEHKLDAIMNDLGRDGGELAAGLNTNQVDQSRDVVVIFKRPVND